MGVSSTAAATAASPPLAYENDEKSGALSIITDEGFRGVVAVSVSVSGASLSGASLSSAMRLFFLLGPDEALFFCLLGAVVLVAFFLPPLLPEFVLAFLLEACAECCLLARPPDVSLFDFLPLLLVPPPPPPLLFVPPPPPPKKENSDVCCLLVPLLLMFKVTMGLRCSLGGSVGNLQIQNRAAGGRPRGAGLLARR